MDYCLRTDPGEETLSNAGKFLPPGRRPVRLVMRARRWLASDGRVFSHYIHPDSHDLLDLRFCIRSSLQQEVKFCGYPVEFYLQFYLMKVCSSVLRSNRSGLTILL